ncbi:Trp biosynthesis-associated membrane protein [Curtobacterium sp. RRHDQ10]|uniref:Trp biosynthesis-associated membrane protein n=1 Tax=Curtobacterium phyllosphaerae TaxID=3413379 RepID=UPI003BEFED62
MRRPVVVLLGLLVAGVVLLSWTQTWFTAHLDAASATATTVTADGSVAASPYSALAIASLALLLAMTIAGPVVRVVLAAIEVLLGIAVVVIGISALGDPIAAASGAIGSVTGVSDTGSIRASVTSIDTTPWPYVGIAGGVLAALLGVVVLVVQRRWPGPSRKYAATPTRARAADVPRDAVTDWDDMSAGTDPTTQPDLADPADPAGATGGAGRTGRTGTVGLDDQPNHEEHREQL